MAQIVAVYAVPHTPSFVADALAAPDDSEALRLFAPIKAHLEVAAPDVIITVNNDHFNTFFFDNWPTFAIGTADRTAGPNDQTPGMPWYELAIQADAARHLHRQFVLNGFDFTSALELEIDHGALVPLHFMTPQMSLPIVPIFVNCVVPPLPPARRVYHLGQVLADAVQSWDNTARVAVIASGSLSLEIGGPRAEPDKTYGVPDRDWAQWVLERISRCEHEALLQTATEDRMLEAGNVAGELLSFILALGIVGPARPDILVAQPALGNAFSAWAIEEAVA